jgi:hypothetical protein
MAAMTCLVKWEDETPLDIVHHFWNGLRAGNDVADTPREHEFFIFHLGRPIVAGASCEGGNNAYAVAPLPAGETRVYHLRNSTALKRHPLQKSSLVRSRWRDAELLARPNGVLSRNRSAEFVVREPLRADRNYDLTKTFTARMAPE